MPLWGKEKSAWAMPIEKSWPFRWHSWGISQPACVLPCWKPMMHKSFLVLAAALPAPLLAAPTLPAPVATEALTPLSPPEAPPMLPAPAPMGPQLAQLVDPEEPESETPALPAHVEVALPPDDAEYDDLIIVAFRERGAVAGDIQPELQLGPREIRALGASSIADLIEALGPELRSGRGTGRPVMLVDGQRISGFQEIRSLPPEAIERIDILPEEVALKYGYSADQRVINFVLRERFRSLTVEVEPGITTAGGAAELEVEANLLRIRNGTRISLEAEYERQSMLRESQRDIAGDPADDPAQVARNAGQRSLISQSDDWQLGGTWAGRLSDSIGMTVNGSFEASDTRGLNGLPQQALMSGAAADPLQRLGESRSGRLATVLNGSLASWAWSLTGAYELSQSDSWTDRDLGASIRTDTATSRSQTGEAELVANGSIAELPAGRVTTTLKAGVRTRDLESESVRGAVLTETDLGRTEGQFQLSVDLPIASSSRDILPALGNLSVNGNVALDTLSDFGTLLTYGYGVNWRPSSRLRILASGTHEEGAPTIQQLGNPFVANPNVRVFDFTTGQTVDITRFDGGNPDLDAEKKRVLKLGVNYEPFENPQISLRAEFLDTHIRRPIAGFPTVTPEIEAAFAERFVRDADGQLLSIDNRPVNFERQDRQELRWGLSWSHTLKPTAREQAEIERRQAAMRERAQARAAAGEGQGPRGEGPRGAGPGGAPRVPGMRGPQPGEGRLNVSLFHTVKFKDEILIRQGVPVLDLLNGSAVGSGGGVARHEVEARVFGAKNGIGGRLSATWQSGTRVLADPRGTPSAEDLFFAPLMTTQARMFVDFGQLPGVARQHPFLRGARLTLGVNNIFDAKQQVRDRAGITPIGYQPDLLDPSGRSVFISFRKLFFPGFRPPAR